MQCPIVQFIHTFQHRQGVLSNLNGYERSKHQVNYVLTSFQIVTNSKPIFAPFCTVRIEIRGGWAQALRMSNDLHELHSGISIIAKAPENSLGYQQLALKGIIIRTCCRNGRVDREK